MAFHPDAATCRRIPLHFITKNPATQADQDKAAAADDACEAPPVPHEPPPLPPGWVDMLHGDVSLDTLFR